LIPLSVYLIWPDGPFEYLMKKNMVTWPIIVLFQWIDGGNAKKIRHLLVAIRI
jgi:hypothetical protein